MFQSTAALWWICVPTDQRVWLHQEHFLVHSYCQACVTISEYWTACFHEDHCLVSCILVEAATTVAPRARSGSIERPISCLPSALIASRWGNSIDYGVRWLRIDLNRFTINGVEISLCSKKVRWTSMAAHVVSTDWKLSVTEDTAINRRIPSINRQFLSVIYRTAGF